MHVNSYFIETLVLCFSCGCDKDNLNYENIGNLSGGATCTMNTPARMILGKQIQWSETVGDQCDGGGPLQYDLEPIKQLVQLQLVHAPKDCGGGYVPPVPSPLEPQPWIPVHSAEPEPWIPEPLSWKEVKPSEPEPWIPVQRPEFKEVQRAEPEEWPESELEEPLTWHEIKPSEPLSWHEVKPSEPLTWHEVKPAEPPQYPSNPDEGMWPDLEIPDSSSEEDIDDQWIPEAPWSEVRPPDHSEWQENPKLEPEEWHQIDSPERPLDWHEVPESEEPLDWHEVSGQEEPLDWQEVPGKEEPLDWHEVPGPEEPLDLHEVPGPEEPLVWHEVPGKEKPLVWHEVSGPGACPPGNPGCKLPNHNDDLQVWNPQIDLCPKDNPNCRLKPYIPSKPVYEPPKPWTPDPDFPHQLKPIPQEPLKWHNVARAEPEAWPETALPGIGPWHEIPAKDEMPWQELPESPSPDKISWQEVPKRPGSGQIPFQEVPDGPGPDQITWQEVPHGPDSGKIPWQEVPHKPTLDQISWQEVPQHPDPDQTPWHEIPHGPDVDQIPWQDVQHGPDSKSWHEVPQSPDHLPWKEGPGGSDNMHWQEVTPSPDKMHWQEVTPSPGLNWREIKTPAPEPWHEVQTSGPEPWHEIHTPALDWKEVRTPAPEPWHEVQTPAPQPWREIPTSDNTLPLLLNDLQFQTVYPIETGQKPPGLETWLTPNPSGEIVIMIDSGETFNVDWRENLRKTILDTHLQHPKYVMNVDWSQYVTSNIQTTSVYSKTVANNLAQWILASDIPIDRLTLIGFGNSAHTAGITGKIVGIKKGRPIHKIVGLNPTGDIYNHLPDTEKLRPSDAKQVLVLHTETAHVGFCCQTGTIDVYVNNPQEGQPWCHGADKPFCSHASAPDILTIALAKGPLEARKELTDEVLFGFPLQIEPDVTGKYHLKIPSLESPSVVVPPHLWPPGTYMPNNWPPTPTNITGYDANNVQIVGLSTGNTFDKLFPIKKPSDHILQWSELNPSGEVVMIITDERPEVWANSIKKAYLRLIDSKYVIVADWSMYKYPSELFTAWYAKEVADELYRWTLLTRIPTNKLTIIGFSTSAHIAGIIGKYHQQNGNPVTEIVALDPEGRMWDHPTETNKLNPDSAETVQVIHTNTQNYGTAQPLGDYDIYVNGGPVQPYCEQQEPLLKDECSHKAAINYFVESFDLIAYAQEATLQPPLAVPTGGPKSLPFGFWLEPTYEPAPNIYVLVTNGPHLIPAPPHTWPQEPADFDWPPINPNLTIGYDAVNLKIVGISSSNSHEQMFPLIQHTDMIDTWQAQYPYGEMIMIITAEPANEWAIPLRNELLKRPDNKFVMIVDWSMYNFKSYRFTAAYSVLVAKAITEWMLTNKVPANRMEIIGFDTSAHVAGLIGNYLKGTGQELQRIVGLDPATDMWSHPMQHDKLSPDSAAIVQVIHTNTQMYGYLEPLGDFDIYPNGGAYQPACEYDENYVDECSHKASINYYIESIHTYTLATEANLVNGLAVEAGSQAIGFGYWLVPDPSVTSHVFSIHTNLQRPLLTPPNIVAHDIMQKDPPNPNEWPPFVPDPRFLEIDINQLVLHMFYHDGNKPVYVPIYLTGRMAQSITFMENVMRTHSTSNVHILINGEHNEEDTWPGLLKDAITSIQPQGLVIIVDWSHYKHSSYIATSKFVQTIGHKLAEVLAVTHARTDLIHIIGHSMGSYIASFIGKATHNVYSKNIYRITALDPSRYMWYHPGVTESNRLTPTDASFVDVIHTDTLNYGFPSPLGHVDFYVNGGRKQPNCPNTGLDFSQCAHKRATEYFLESLNLQALAVKINYQDENKLIFIETTEFATFGYYVKPDTRGAFYLITTSGPPYLKSQKDRPPEVFTPYQSKQKTKSDPFSPPEVDIPVPGMSNTFGRHTSRRPGGTFRPKQPATPRPLYGVQGGSQISTLGPKPGIYGGSYTSSLGSNGGSYGSSLGSNGGSHPSSLGSNGGSYASSLGSNGGSYSSSLGSNGGSYASSMGPNGGSYASSIGPNGGSYQSGKVIMNGPNTYGTHSNQVFIHHEQPEETRVHHEILLLPAEPDFR